MSAGININSFLRPVQDTSIQAYFGQGLHTLSLLRWLLPQTGSADVFLSSYSTSEPFLNGFHILKRKRLVRKSMILLDQRAARKTIQLERLLSEAFDNVFLGQNHSKILLIRNNHFSVSVVTSQNQTYGGRAECTIITTDKAVFDVLMAQFVSICGDGAVELDIKNGQGIITENRRTGIPDDDSTADWRPFGLEW